MAGKLFTEFEVSQKIRDLYLKLNCIVLTYSAFNKFPRPGKAHTLYIDTSTDPNELWRWDCTIRDYVQIGGGGGGGGGTDAIHFSQLTFNQFDDGASSTQVINDTPTNYDFSSLANIGTDVVGSLATNSIVVSEAAWYQIEFSSLSITNVIGDINFSIYKNGDLLAEIYLYSGSVVNGHVNHSWNKKVNLQPNDEISIKISRPIIQGATTIDRTYADFSVQKITLGYIEALTGINIPQSVNYAALPLPGTEVGLYRWVLNTVGADNAGLYYSDGLTWETAPTPVQVNSDWNAITGPEEILNKPTVPVITQLTSITIPAASFTLVSGLYEADYANVNFLATSVVSITPKNSTIAIVTTASFLPEITVSLGSIKMYANNLPSGDFDVDILIIN